MLADSDAKIASSRAQLTLSRLDDSAGYALPRLFIAPLPAKSRLAWLFPALAVAPIAMLGGAVAGVTHGWANTAAARLELYCPRLVAAEAA